MSNQLEKIKELIERRATARLGGGEKSDCQTARKKENIQPANVLQCY